MKNWLDDPRFDCLNEVYFKSMEKFLNVEDVVFEENKNLLV
jgi:hypothetical protein